MGDFGDRDAVPDQDIPIKLIDGRFPVLTKNGAVRMSYRELVQRYNELLLAVVRKFPGESRHRTALRYIREAEERVSVSNLAATAKDETAPHK